MTKKSHTDRQPPTLTTSYNRPAVHTHSWQLNDLGWSPVASRGSRHSTLLPAVNDTFHQSISFDRGIVNHQYAFPWHFLPETVVTPVKVAELWYITAAARKPTRFSHFTNSLLQMVFQYSSYCAIIHAPLTFSTRIPTVGFIYFYHAMPVFKQIDLISLIRLAKGRDVYFNYILVTQQSASQGRGFLRPVWNFSHFT